MAKWKKTLWTDWQYSRTARRHWVDDGELYWDCEAMPYRVLQIKCQTPYGQIPHRKYGYKMYYKANLIMHARTVKECKLLAEIKYGKTNKARH